MVTNQCREDDNFPCHNQLVTHFNNVIKKLSFVNAWNDFWAIFQINRMEKQGTTTYLQRHIATFFRKLHPVSMSQLLQVIARREKHAWSCISSHLRNWPRRRIFDDDYNVWPVWEAQSFSPLNIGPIIASIDPDLFIACLLQNFVQQRLSSKSVMIRETVFIWVRFGFINSEIRLFHFQETT